MVVFKPDHVLVCLQSTTNMFLFLFKGEDVEVKKQLIESSSATHKVGANRLCECRLFNEIM